MTQDIKLAFAHPEARAQATPDTGADPRDRISVRDHVVAVEIGAFQAERGVTQRIRFNVVVEVAPLPPDLGDDVDRILSYDRITEAIEGELSEDRLNLLETLAERVAERILIEPQAMRAFVRIEKLDRGPGTLGVEIVRSRAQVQPQAVDVTLDPVVVHFDNAVFGSSHLTRWIDQLEAQARPVLITVGRGPLPAPVTGHKMTQRRIDLLTIEQNAWALAAQDDRCVVVETRTELDWGLKNDQIGVWAPSKLVLDAVDGPDVAVTETAGLTMWFAAQMQAAEVIFVGGPAPDGAQSVRLDQDLPQ